MVNYRQVPRPGTSEVCPGRRAVAPDLARHRVTHSVSLLQGALVVLGLSGADAALPGDA